MNWLILMAALTVGQGQALRIDLPGESGLENASVQWRGETVPFGRMEEGWLTYVGADLDVKPGEYPAKITLEYSDGRTRAITEVITVEAREFPRTELEVEKKYVSLSDENQQRAAKERQEISTIYKNTSAEALWDEPFLVPIPGTTGGRNFGHRRVFNGQPRAPHSGADLTAATGTEILATNRGRVVLAKDLFFSGNAVFIDHGLGIYSVYLHLSEIMVEPGEMVERGQLVGLAGATGRVTGPHLHWGVRAQGARVDPFSLLD
ncbi:MAG: peptidoglycan DD-metalloendopeptidase family protein [Gammaproteobacteria bacterium]|nr:peptidoglycan DD-metalloendopeptidase family protein [Gammaproteobacteria bacterium]